MITVELTRSTRMKVNKYLAKGVVSREVKMDDFLNYPFGKHLMVKLFITEDTWVYVEIKVLKETLINDLRTFEGSLTLYNQHKIKFLKVRGQILDLFKTIDLDSLRKNKNLNYKYEDFNSATTHLEEDFVTALKESLTLLFLVSTILEKDKEIIKIDEKDKEMTVSTKKKSVFKLNNLTELRIKLPTVDNFISRTSSHKKTSHNWKVEEFTRRGHWRTYKNGKKVWINKATVTPQNSENLYKKEGYKFNIVD